MKTSRLIQYTFLFLTISLLYSCAGAGPNGSTRLAANDFNKKIQETSGALILDVRTPEEFDKGHLKNAFNIDWNGDEFEVQTAKLDKNKTVFVYCLSGSRSASAASAMRSEGFKDVIELDGGIMKWRALNLPEEHHSAASGYDADAFKTLITSDKLVLVDFYADWCAPCKKMKPWLDEINSTMSDKVTVIRINADDHQPLLRSLGIDALPVLHIYKDQNLVWSNAGYIEKDKVVAALLTQP